MGNWNIRIKIGVNGGWDRIKVPGLPSQSQSLCIYVVFFPFGGVPLRKAGYPLGIIHVPSILAARIFPSPGQREKLISPVSLIFSQLPKIGGSGSLRSGSTSWSVVPEGEAIFASNLTMKRKETP